MVALAGLGQAGYDGIFKVRKRQLAGAEEDGLVRDGDIEVRQQPVESFIRPLISQQLWRGCNRES